MTDEQNERIRKLHETLKGRVIAEAISEEKALRSYLLHGRLRQEAVREAAQLEQRHPWLAETREAVAV